MKQDESLIDFVVSPAETLGHEVNGEADTHASPGTIRARASTFTSQFD